jgi:hypothetical protein
LLAASDGLSESIVPQDVLQAVLDNVAQLAIRQHPLGFLHFDLSPLADLPNATLRLHLWSARSVDAVDELGKKHDHVWTLKSVVLLGALTDVQLDASPDPLGDFVAVQITYGTAENRIEPTGQRYVLSEVDRRPIQARQVYTLGERLIHETEVRTFPTATLLAATPAAAGSPLVLTPYGSRPLSPSSTRPLVRASDAAAELRSALESIHSA